jgi:hypothetical protein
MKIAIVSSIYPYPTDTGGKQRIVSIINFLIQKGFVVELICLVEKRDLPLHIPKNTKLKVTCFCHSRNKKAFNILLNFWRHEPFQVSMNRNRNLQNYLSKRSFDHVIVHMVRMSWVKIEAPATLEMVDSVAHNYSRHIESLSWNHYGVKDLLYKYELKLLKKYEVEAIERFNKTVLVSSLDKDYVISNRIFGEEVQAVSFEKKINIIPLTLQTNIGSNTDRSDKTRNSVLFIGKLDYQPNEQAVAYFLKEIFGSLISKHPELRFVLIGKNPTQKIKTLMSNFEGKVDHINFAEDLYSYMDDSFCSVAPMLSGSGMQTKIIDSMTYAVPVVTTLIGFGDFKFKNGVEIVIADDSQNIVDEISNLYVDKAKGYTIGVSGKAAVEREYGKDVFSRLYSEVLVDE